MELINAESPEDVVKMLNEASENFYEPQEGQDKKAQKLWSKIAYHLEQCADKINNTIKKVR